jgi:hypothetical protein
MRSCMHTGPPSCGERGPGSAGKQCCPTGPSMRSCWDSTAAVCGGRTSSMSRAATLAPSLPQGCHAAGSSACGLPPVRCTALLFALYVGQA